MRSVVDRNVVMQHVTVYTPLVISGPMKNWAELVDGPTLYLRSQGVGVCCVCCVCSARTPSSLLYKWLALGFRPSRK